MDALKMAEDLKKNELRKQFLKSFKADIQKKWVNSGFECTHRCRYHQAPRPLAFHREYHRESSPACVVAATLGMSVRNPTKGQAHWA